MRPRIIHLFYENKDGSLEDVTITKFFSSSSQFAKIKHFIYITCDVGEKELYFKAIRSRSRSSQWNIYQINIKGESKDKEDYCFFFVSKDKQEFLNKFEKSLKKKLDDNGDIEAKVTLSGR